VLIGACHDATSGVPPDVGNDSIEAGYISLLLCIVEWRVLGAVHTVKGHSSG
jgi:hypothetical protein